MAPKKSTEQLPAVQGNGNGGKFAIATPESLTNYMFMNREIFEAIRENLGGEPITPSDFQKIKFPSGTNKFWLVPTLEGDDAPEKTIQGIVLMRKNTRVYWVNEYSGDKTPPDCSSTDGITGTGTPGGVCATCPFAQWESGRNGGQACKAVGVQLVMIPGAGLPIIIPIPPTSNRPMKKFMLGLASQNLRASDCVLSFALETAKNKGGIEYPQIKPTLVAVLPDKARLELQGYVAQFKGAFESYTAQKDDVSQGDYPQAD